MNTISKLRSFPSRLHIWLRLTPNPFESGFRYSRLSPYRKFRLLGSDEELLFDSSVKGSVLILGAYQGLSSHRWLKNGNKVTAFEPVLQFFNKARERFEGFSGSQLFQAGLSDRNEMIEMAILQDSSSAYRSPIEGKSETVKMVDAAEFVLDSGPFEVMEINIEGGEYQVLPRLIESNAVIEIQTLFIQFHNDIPGAEELASSIREGLGRTHQLSWSFPWVWERWDRK